MHSLRRYTWLFACLLLLALPGSASALGYGPAYPYGTLGFRSPHIGMPVRLSADEALLKHEFYLNGTLVPSTWDGKQITYKPLEPLAPGVYEARVVIHYRDTKYPDWTPRPAETKWTFTIAPGALATLPEPDPEQLRALDYLNRYRAIANLPAVRYDLHLSAAAMAHAFYQSSNNITGHYQEEGKANYLARAPWDRAKYFGYGGGMSEVIAYVGRAEAGVDNLMETIYHRVPLVHPGYTEMGYGYGGTTLQPNVIKIGPGSRTDKRIIAWPVPGQKDVPLGWSGRESPDPLRLYPGTKGPVGYTITLTWGGPVRNLKLAQSSLKEPDGTAVPVMTFSPETDSHLRDTVSLIPYKPLKPSTTYTVHMKGTYEETAGTPLPYDKTWSFTTSADLKPDFGSASWGGSTRTGGPNFTVSGSGYQPGMKVFLGGLPVRDLKVEPTRISFRLPEGFTGEESELVAVSPGGQEKRWRNFYKTPSGESSPFAEAAPQLAIAGQKVALSGLQHSSGALLIPESELERLGAAPFRLPELKRTYWSIGGRSGDLATGSPVSTVGSQQILLPLSPTVRNGTTYVPLAFAEALFSGVTDWKDPSRGLRDIWSHWARAAVVRLVDSRVISGMGDGTFRPDGRLSRAAFVKMLAAAQGLPLQPGATGGFADLNGHWVANQGFIGAAVKAGVIRPEEYAGGQFQPDRDITREEIAVMVVRALGLESSAATRAATATGGRITVGERTFTDAAGWGRRGHVVTAVEAGIVSGYKEADGSFTYRAANPATRAEAAIMVTRMLDQQAPK